MSLLTPLRLLLSRSTNPATSATPDIVALARASVDDGYHGPPADEPHVHAMLERLRAQASRAFRTHPELRQAQARLAAAQRTLDDREAEQAAAATPPAAADTSPQARAGRTRARVAAARVRAAQATHTATETEVVALEARVLDEISVPVEAGLGPVNTYLAEFNAHAAYKGRPTIGMLNEGDTVRAILADAVQPVHTSN